MRIDVPRQDSSISYLNSLVGKSYMWIRCWSSMATSQRPSGEIARSSTRIFFVHV